MWPRRFCVLFILTLGCVSVASAAEAVRDHDVTLDDYFTQSFVTDAIISPDGRDVVYTELRWEPPRATRNPDLWLASTEGLPPRRLTFEFGPENTPQWSPDGEYIYYLASRKRDDGKYAPYNDKPQIWRLPISWPGEATPVSRVDEGIDAFQLSPTGSAAYYTISKDVKEDEWKSLQGRFDKLTYGHGKHNASEVWKLDLQSWRAEVVVAPKRFIHEFNVSADERRVAMITTPDEELISMEGWSQVDVFDTAQQKTTTLPDELFRKLAPSPFGWLKSPAWSSDGTRLAFIVNFDGFPAEIIVAQWSGREPRMSKLARPEDVHADEARLMWGGAAELYCMGHWHGRKRVYRIRNINDGSQGPTDIVTPGDVVVQNFSVARKGDHLAVVKADPSNTEDVYVIGLRLDNGSHKRLTEVNPQMRSWKLPQVKLVEWKGGDGDKVEGILELPPGYREGDKPLPLVLDIHGGPTADTPYCLRYWVYGDLLFAAKGYARLSPNYHGSVGYGDGFMTKLIGRENDIEVKDLLAGVDALIARGVADPKRLGVMGWSNGGYLTNAVVAADQRFKAASSGAGVLDQFLQWGLEDTPGHVINYMSGKLPWQAPEEYRKASPSYQLDKIKTPMLIHVGENDERVPAEHARVLHRALQRYLKVPTQLVIYPGEPHGLTQLEHRRAKMVWDHAWFDHYLLGKPIPDGK